MNVLKWFWRAGGLGLDAPKTTLRVRVLSEVEGSLALGDRGDSGPQFAGRSPRSSWIGPGKRPRVPE
jgi:hypothetical protein